MKKIFIKFLSIICIAPLIIYIYVVKFLRFCMKNDPYGPPPPTDPDGDEFFDKFKEDL